MILMTADNIQDQFCFTTQARDTVESNEQSIDSNVENAANRRHANLSEYIRIHPNYVFVVLARHLAFILHFHLDRNFCM